MITVIGAGKVGSAGAFDILRYKIADVILIDTNEKAAQGEALDMMQAAPAIEFDGKIHGTSDFREMQGSELVIVTAGLGRISCTPTAANSSMTSTIPPSASWASRGRSRGCSSTPI